MRSDFQFDYWAAFEAGQGAAKAGLKELHNPHQPGSGAANAWRDGFRKPEFKRGRG